MPVTAVAERSETRVIRILIADDHHLVRAGMKALIERHEDLQVIGQAANGQEAVRLYDQLLPDMLMIDLRMPVMDGLNAIKAIRETHPMARILILTSFDGEEDVYQGLRAGARGYCLKDSTPEELIISIRMVAAGQKRVPPSVASRLIERMSGSQLTEREIDVLRLMAQGQSNHQIGTALRIKEGTVKTHVNNILTKLEVDDRMKAVIIGLKRGLIVMD